MPFSQEEYILAAKSHGHSPEFIDVTIKYAQKLITQQLPVIFTLEHLSSILGMPILEIKDIINSRRKYYKFYEIKKRNGNGVRQIMAPHNNLRQVQKYINDEILSNISLHESATGFTKGKSILDNALPHINKNAILNIDLLRFFDSISEKRVYGIFKSLGYASNLSVDLAKLTTVKLPEEYFNTFDNKELSSYLEIVPKGSCILPQGAPTSPMLSNLILRNLDLRLSKLAEKLDVHYSRYADDITFSGVIENLPKIKLIRRIIRDEGFNINWKKVGIYKKGRKQIVTGLTVSNNAHIHRNFKKEVKKHIYACNTFGVKNHLKFMHLEEIGLYKEWLLGKIYFIKSIEPEIALKLMIEFNKIVWPI